MEMSKKNLTFGRWSQIISHSDQAVKGNSRAGYSHSAVHVCIENWEQKHGKGRKIQGSKDSRYRTVKCDVKVHEVIDEIRIKGSWEKQNKTKKNHKMA